MRQVTVTLYDVQIKRIAALRPKDDLTNDADLQQWVAAAVDQALSNDVQQVRRLQEMNAALREEVGLLRRQTAGLIEANVENYAASIMTPKKEFPPIQIWGDHAGVAVINWRDELPTITVKRGQRIHMIVTDPVVIQPEAD